MGVQVPGRERVARRDRLLHAVDEQLELLIAQVVELPGVVVRTASLEAEVRVGLRVVVVGVRVGREQDAAEPLEEGDVVDAAALLV